MGSPASVWRVLLLHRLHFSPNIDIYPVHRLLKRECKSRIDTITSLARDSGNERATPRGPEPMNRERFSRPLHTGTSLSVSPFELKESRPCLIGA